MGCLRATRPLQLSRLLPRMVEKMQPISRIWHSDKVLWEQEGCHLQDLTTALAHRMPIRPHRRVLCHNHRLVVPHHRLGRLHTQHLRFTIAQEDRLLQRIPQRLLHSTLHLRDTLLLVHDTHLPRLRFHPHHLGIALSRLPSARHLPVILRQVHPSAPLLLDTLQLHLPTICRHRRQNTLLRRRWHRRPRQNIPLLLLRIHQHHQHTHPPHPLTAQPLLLGRPPALLKIRTELRGATLINPVRRGSKKYLSGLCLNSFQNPLFAVLSLLHA